MLPLDKEAGRRQVVLMLYDLLLRGLASTQLQYDRDGDQIVKVKAGVSNDRLDKQA